MNENHSSMASATVVQHIKPVKKPANIPNLEVPSREHLVERLMWWTEPNEKGCWIWKGTKTPVGYGRMTIRVNGKARLQFVHRLSHELFIGPIPDGLCVCHRCDTPSCCAPAHVFLGTMAENIQDRDQKNRTAKGDKHWSKLHPDLLARGDEHWTKRQPEKVKRGDQHHARLHPERMAHGDKNGSRLHPELLNPPRGSKHANAKLTEEIVADIRKLYATGTVTQRVIAERFSVTQSLVSMVVKRVIWSHVQ